MGSRLPVPLIGVKQCDLTTVIAAVEIMTKMTVLSQGYLPSHLIELPDQLANFHLKITQVEQFICIYIIQEVFQTSEPVKIKGPHSLLPNVYGLTVSRAQ